MDAQAEQLVRDYLPLAQSLAQQVWRTAPHALELDELRAISYLGLVGAATRWAPYCAEHGHSPTALQYFRPFMVRRCHGAMMDAIRSSDWATRSLRTRGRALQAAGQDRGVGERELAARTGLSVAEVRATIRALAARPVSLEAEEVEPRAGLDVESTAFTAQLLGVLVTAMAQLSAEQQTVVALHYYKGIQLQQIARLMRITESRVSELHASAVLSIHHAMLDVAHERSV